MPSGRRKQKPPSAEVSLHDLAHLTRNGEAVPVRLPWGHRWIVGIVIAMLGPLGAAGVWAIKSHVQTRTHLKDDAAHLREGERDQIQTKPDASQQHRLIRATFEMQLERVRAEQKQADAHTHKQINELLTEARRTRRTMERGGPP